MSELKRTDIETTDINVPDSCWTAPVLESNLDAGLEATGRNRSAGTNSECNVLINVSSDSLMIGGEPAPATMFS